MMKVTVQLLYELNIIDCYCVAKAMGWSEGQGLGRDNQGIIDPIKVHVCCVCILVMCVDVL